MENHALRRYSRRVQIEKCAHHFDRQHGAIAAYQALEAGLSQRAIQLRVEAGLWETLLPRVYRLAGARQTWYQRLFAAVLWAGQNVLVSHRAAAAIWGLDGFRPGIVELALPRRKTAPVEWIVMHHSGRLSDLDRTEVNGLPVTTVARTLCDIGAVARPRRVQDALDHALRARLTDRDQLVEYLARLGGRGSAGVGVLRTLLEDPLQGAISPGSPLERRFVRILARARIPEPERQYPVYDAEGIIGRLDFAWPEIRLGMEVDGFSAHSSRRSFRHDRARRNRLTRVDWRLIHATAEDGESPERLLRLLRSFLSQKTT